MSQEFLRAASLVLQLMGRPLKVKDIVQKALDENILTTIGKTPINTMRARLSENIRTYGDSSDFMRIGPNRIALRRWDYNEFKSKPFEKNNDDEELVCITQDSLDKFGRFFGFKKTSHYLQMLADPNNLRIVNKLEAKKRYDIKQLVSYILLRDKKGRLLSYRRGNYGNKDSLLKGVLCIGFGGHVNRNDIDLFGLDNAGIFNSGYREIFEEIKRLRIDRLKLLGAINDDSSPLGLNHFAFVFEAKLPKDFDEIFYSKELSINQVKLLTVEELWGTYHELEFWSQLLLKNYIDKDNNIKFGFTKSKRKSFLNNPLVINGEIGSGKTEVTRYLQEKYEAGVVSTRACVCELLNIKDFGDNDRSQFQKKSKQLVATERGIQALANLISKKIQEQGNKFVIIDGIRNIETYNIIKSRIPNINLMYIDNPRDVAFRFYRDRSLPRTVTIKEFRDARSHPVEKEVVFFKDLADVYVYNGESLDHLYLILDEWIKKYNITE